LPVLTTQITTHHAPEHLLELVSDAARYPEFINFIKQIRISAERTSEVISSKRADVVVGFKGFTERFTTDIQTDAAKKTVNVALVRGPFKRLKNDWRFAVCEDGKTQIDFHIDYAFSNPLLAMVAHSNTQKAVGLIMNAFIEEADRRYGVATDV